MWKIIALCIGVIASNVKSNSLSPLKLWVWTPFMARCTRYNIMWQTLSRFSPGSPVSSTNKTDSHDITEILFKVTLNTINHTIKSNTLETRAFREGWGWIWNLLIFSLVKKTPCKFYLFHTFTVQNLDCLELSFKWLL